MNKDPSSNKDKLTGKRVLGAVALVAFASVVGTIHYVHDRFKKPKTDEFSHLTDDEYFEMHKNASQDQNKQND